MSRQKPVDVVRMTPQQIAAGKRAWDRSGALGRMSKSSFDAEAMAPKTWILYANSKGEEIATIECELHTVGRASNASEAVVMLHGMCPKCGETFIAREDNKTMRIDYIEYRKAPQHLKINWRYHSERVLGRRWSESDKIPVVSSPERWACDYCRGWCVRVSAGVAVDDHKGVTQMYMHQRPHLIDKGEGGGEPG
jgi:ribosomal protein S27AE